MTLTRTNGGGGGGGSSLTVKDEGVTLSSAVTSIDVVGPRLTATNVGGAVTLTHADLAWVANHPDTPPASPTTFGGTVYDLEFVRDGSTGSGTDLGSPATAPSIVDRALRIVGGTLGTADAKGREWLCPPSTSFTMTAKIRRYVKVSSSFGVVTLMLRAGTSGAGNFSGLGSAQNGAPTTLYLEGQRYTSVTNRPTVFSSTTMGTVIVPCYYVRTIYSNGVGMTYQFSMTGHPDSFETIGTDTQASGLGAAPGRFGLVIDSFSTTVAWKAYCEWIRFT